MANPDKRQEQTVSAIDIFDNGIESDFDLQMELSAQDFLIERIQSQITDIAPILDQNNDFAFFRLVTDEGENQILITRRQNSVAKNHIAICSNTVSDAQIGDPYYPNGKKLTLTDVVIKNLENKKNKTMGSQQEVQFCRESSLQWANPVEGSLLKFDHVARKLVVTGNLAKIKKFYPKKTKTLTGLYDNNSNLLTCINVLKLCSWGTFEEDVDWFIRVH